MTDTDDVALLELQVAVLLILHLHTIGSRKQTVGIRKSNSRLID